jgi:hypothetical protein
MPGSARLLRAGDHDLDYKRVPGPRWRAGLRHHAIDGPAPALARDHVRRRAAAAGLEASHPLLDPDVVELMLRLPPELSWDRENTRPVLRAAVDGLVPDHVRLRHGKSHFDQLFHGSLSGPDLPFLRSLLGTRTPEVAAYLDPGRLRTELLERVPGPGGHLESWAIQVWRIATAECWLRSLGDPAWPATALARGGLDEPRISFGGPPLFSLAQPGAIGNIAP